MSLSIRAQSELRCCTMASLHKAADDAEGGKKKKRKTTRFHTRAKRLFPFYIADHLFDQHLPGRMLTKNVGMYFTVVAEEVSAALLETSAKYVSTKGVTKSGKRRGRIKASCVAKGLNDKDAMFFGVIPNKVCGEFVKNESVSRLLEKSYSNDNQPTSPDQKEGKKKRKRHRRRRKRIEKRSARDIEEEEEEEEEGPKEVSSVADSIEEEEEEDEDGIDSE
jgi:hypothetical protein